MFTRSKRSVGCSTLVESQESAQVCEKVMNVFSKRVKMTIKNELSEGVCVEVRDVDKESRVVSSAGLMAGALPALVGVGGEIHMESIGHSEETTDKRYVAPLSETTFVVGNGKEQVVSIQTKADNKTVFEGRRVVGGRTRTLRILPKHVPP